MAFQAPAETGDVPLFEMMVAEGQVPQVHFGPVSTLPDGRSVIVVDISY